MTKNARWSLAVCEYDRGRCAAREHDPRCRGIGEHAHHINYKAHIPKKCYWIRDNGIWLSNLCHSLAHKTHNANLPTNRRHFASIAVRIEILLLYPHKPELLLSVPLFEEAA